MSSGRLLAGSMTAAPPFVGGDVDGEAAEHIPSRYFEEIASTANVASRIIIRESGDGSTDSDDDPSPGEQRRRARAERLQLKRESSNPIELNADADPQSDGSGEDAGSGPDAAPAPAADRKTAPRSTANTTATAATAACAVPPPPSSTPPPSPPPSPPPPPPSSEPTPITIGSASAAGTAESAVSPTNAAATAERARERAKRKKIRNKARAVPALEADANAPAANGTAAAASSGVVSTIAGTAAAGSDVFGRVLTPHSYVIGRKSLRVPDMDHSYAFNAVGKKVCRQLRADNVNSYCLLSDQQTSAYTLLHTAALATDIDLAIHCLRCGADINRLSANAETAVQLAVGSALALAAANSNSTKSVVGIGASSASAAVLTANKAIANNPHARGGGSEGKSNQSSAIAAHAAAAHSALAMERRVSTISYLLDAGGWTTVNNRTSHTGATALHDACRMLLTASPASAGSGGGAMEVAKLSSHHNTNSAAVSAAARTALLEHSLLCCELLLRFGADSDLTDFEGKQPIDFVSAKAERARFEKLFSSYKTAARPKFVRKCWCASGEDHSLCHGLAVNATHRLLPIVPDWIDCPCANQSTTASIDTTSAAGASGTRPAHKYRSYGRCCKRKGVIYRENDREFIREVRVANPAAVQTLTQYTDAITAQQTNTPASAAPPAALDAKTAAALAGSVNASATKAVELTTAAQASKLDKEAKTAIIAPLVASGSVDRAYFYALLNVDFWPNLWPTPASVAAAAAASGAAANGKAASSVVPIDECVRRQKEWNACVDRYIRNAKALEEDRTPLEVSRAVKIAVNGGALHRPCGNRLSGGCGKFESKESEFKVCGVCKGVVYCTRECQKQSWNSGGHKTECTQIKAARERDGFGSLTGIELPSQTILRSAMKNVSKAVLQSRLDSMKADELAKKAARIEAALNAAIAGGK